MPPKPKGKNFPPVRVTDELLLQTQECADVAGEYLSDYIRKAVIIRNEHMKTVEKIPADKIIEHFINKPDSFDIEVVKPRTIKAKNTKINQVQTFFKK
jgi:hypothetical protein